MSGADVETLPYFTRLAGWLWYRYFKGNAKPEILQRTALKHDADAIESHTTWFHVVKDRIGPISIERDPHGDKRPALKYQESDADVRIGACIGFLAYAHFEVGCKNDINEKNSKQYVAVPQIPNNFWEAVWLRSFWFGDLCDMLITIGLGGYGVHDNRKTTISETSGQPSFAPLMGG